MLRCPLHHVEDLQDEIERDVLVEQVAHRIDEDHARLPPMQRQIEHVRMERELKAVTVVGLAHGAEPLRHALGVAVLGSPG